MLKEDKRNGCLSYKIREVKFPALCTPTRHLIFTKIHYLVIQYSSFGAICVPRHFNSAYFSALRTIRPNIWPMQMVCFSTNKKCTDDTKYSATQFFACFPSFLGYLSREVSSQIVTHSLTFFIMLISVSLWFCFHHHHPHWIWSKCILCVITQIRRKHKTNKN